MSKMIPDLDQGLLPSRSNSNLHQQLTTLTFPNQNESAQRPQIPVPRQESRSNVSHQDLLKGSALIETERHTTVAAKVKSSN
jgi:hypothetical protein